MMACLRCLETLYKAWTLVWEIISCKPSNRRVTTARMARHIVTTVLLTVCVYLLLQNTSRHCAGSPAPRPYPRNPHHQPRIELNFLDDDEAMEKRQFNDYGHMRFGKRGNVDEKFDDYGYMRFGRGLI